MSDGAMDEWDFEPHVLYRIYDGFGRPLYIGETNNLPRRLAEHMEKAWFRRPDITIKLTMFPNRAEAYAAQNHAIAAEKPWYNKAALQSANEPRQATAAIAPKARVPAAPRKQVTLREAIAEGVIGRMSLAAARTARARDPEFPAAAGRDGITDLYDADALRAWAERRSRDHRLAAHSISA